MNVYDFDGTVFHGDSTRRFICFMLRRHPRMLLGLPRQIFCLAAYGLGRMPIEQTKETFLSCLSKLSDVDNEVRAFWDANEKHMMDWYMAQRQPDDQIVSASPTFLLEEIAGRLGVMPPIATQADKRTGRIMGRNCKGPEKVLRFRAVYGDCAIDAFYSDSRTDAPMAQQAKRAYLVTRKGNVVAWPTDT